MPELAFVDQDFVALEHAVISIDDRGFTLSDAVYELLIAIRGRVFQMDAYLTRLENSANGAAFRSDLDKNYIRDQITEGLLRADIGDCAIKMILTRGSSPRRTLAMDGCTPSLVILFQDREKQRSVDIDTSLHLCAVPDIRDGMTDIKCTSMLAETVMTKEARARGGSDALIVDANGNPTSSCAGMLFAHVGSQLITPCRRSAGIFDLEDSIVSDAARECGLRTLQKKVSMDELRCADELFLVNELLHVTKVASIDRRVIGQAARREDLFRAIQKHIESLLTKHVAVLE